MPYIGNPIYQSAFVTDQFSGDGSTTAFTMSVAPAGVTNVLVAVSGVLQDPSTYGVTGTTITFSTAPPSGTGNISCRYLGIPVTGIVTTAYRTVTEFTATASQTTFTPPSYTVGYINVYRNGVLLGSADYTATNGTTVVLATGATAGDIVTVESFRVESVLNAISNSAGSVGTSNLADSSVTTAKIASGVTVNFADGSASTPSITNDGDTNTGMFFPAADTIAFAEGGVESMRIDSSGNVGIGTTSPQSIVGINVGLNDTKGLVLQYSGDAKGGILLNPIGGEVRMGSINSTGTYFTTFYANNTEQMRITSAGLLQFNSGYGSVATAYGCRAWVNFNGTGTVAIRASGNVSSITDVGVGQYTVNLTNSMPDANYSVGVNTDYDGVGFGVNAKNFATGSFSVQCILPNLSNYTDHSLVNCQVFR